ncbi:MAG TPA: response regulator transcription factor [Gemmatimonadaceae bacterium]|jgi:DNA-binding response OmpR family regulator|nr:response regulator transcription factor [Gemmatimonadaceae bacterium]
MTRLLLLEDERHRLSPLRSALEVTGYEVDTATARATARAVALFGVVRPALAVLDIGRRGGAAADALVLIRGADRVTPILVIGASGSDADLVRAFARGADDYMATPADAPIVVPTLLARIRALLRRAHAGEESGPSWIRFGEIAIHPVSRTVRRNGEPVTLTPTEYELLLTLVRYRGVERPRRDLFRDVWGEEGMPGAGSLRRVDTYMAALRRKLEGRRATPRYLRTVPGGYMFLPPREHRAAAGFRA